MMPRPNLWWLLGTDWLGRSPRNRCQRASRQIGLRRQERCRAEKPGRRCLPWSIPLVGTVECQYQAIRWPGRRASPEAGDRQSRIARPTTARAAPDAIQRPSRPAFALSLMFRSMSPITRSRRRSSRSRRAPTWRATMRSRRFKRWKTRIASTRPRRRLHRAPMRSRLQCALASCVRSHGHGAKGPAGPRRQWSSLTRRPRLLVHWRVRVQAVRPRMRKSGPNLHKGRRHLRSLRAPITSPQAPAKAGCGRVGATASSRPTLLASSPQRSRHPASLGRRGPSSRSDWRGP